MSSLLLFVFMSIMFIFIHMMKSDFHKAHSQIERESFKAMIRTAPIAH